MRLFDTHFHYYGENTPAEYRRMIQTELELPPQNTLPPVERLYLLAAGGDYLETQRSLEFTRVIPDAWFAAGVHPHQAENFDREREDCSIFRHEAKLAAVGEIGLDYYYESSPREIQQRVFESFLERALDWKLPAIIHIRDRDGAFDAYQDAYDRLQSFAADGGRFVAHCFAGTPAWAERLLELGAYLGVTGMATFPKAFNIRETLGVIPMERLLLETDAPYLAPVPHRGKGNHPGYLVWVADRVAAERGISIEKLAEITTRNGFAFFGLPAGEGGL